jgi:hypothetical protein
MSLFIGLVAVGGLLWWAGFWPFDGNTSLPRRDRGPHHTPGSPSNPGNPPSV